MRGIAGGLVMVLAAMSVASDSFGAAHGQPLPTSTPGGSQAAGAVRLPCGTGGAIPGVLSVQFAAGTPPGERAAAHAAAGAAPGMESVDADGTISVMVSVPPDEEGAAVRAYVARPSVRFVGPVVQSVPLCSPIRPGSGIRTVRVAYAAGWNLVAGPPGTVLNSVGVRGPLYSLGPGDVNYRALSPDIYLEPGSGYWVYFGAAATVDLAEQPTTLTVVRLPAGQYVLVGHPYITAASTSGADVVYEFEPGSGYRATSVLQPGQGAWAYSSNGATMVIRPITTPTPSGSMTP